MTRYIRHRWLGHNKAQTGTPADAIQSIAKRAAATLASSSVWILASALAVAAVSGCGSKVQEEDSPYISFRNVAQVPVDAAKSGAGDIITNSDERLREQPFGVFGYKSVVEGSSPTNVFVGTSAQEVGWDNTLKAWSYTPKRRWEMSMHYSFRAYWPYSAEINSASDAKRLAVEYKSTTEQYDLLVAYATRYPLQDAEGINAVPLKFKHALAGLKFNIKFKPVATGVNDITKDYVTRFYMTGLYSVGSLIYGQQEDTDDAEKMEWVINENNYDETTKMFEWTGREEFDLNEDTAASVFDNDKAVLVIPQTISSSEDKTTKAYFYTEAGGDALHTVNLPRTELKPGYIYTFNFIIHNSYLTVSIDIQDWNKIQSNVDINL